MNDLHVTNKVNSLPYFENALITFINDARFSCELSATLQIQFLNHIYHNVFNQRKQIKKKIIDVVWNHVTSKYNKIIIKFNIWLSFVFIQFHINCSVFDNCIIANKFNSGITKMFQVFKLPTWSLTVKTLSAHLSDGSPQS